MVKKSFKGKVYGQTDGYIDDGGAAITVLDSTFGSDERIKTHNSTGLNIK